MVVVAYSSELHRTKSSAYIAHYTEDGNFLIRSLLNTKKRFGDRTSPCGTPCLRSIFLAFVLSTTTVARRLFRYNLIHRHIFPAMVHFFSFRSRLPNFMECFLYIDPYSECFAFVLESVFIILC